MDSELEPDNIIILSTAYQSIIEKVLVVKCLYAIEKC